MNFNADIAAVTLRTVRQRHIKTSGYYFPVTAQGGIVDEPSAVGGWWTMLGLYNTIYINPIFEGI